MIAGLEDISAGTLQDRRPRSSTTLGPKERDIAMVFQNYALYPHMTVADNIGFALKLRKLPKAEIDQKVGGCRPDPRPDASGSTASRASFRRSAPARRDGPRDRAQPVACS